MCLISPLKIKKKCIAMHRFKKLVYSEFLRVPVPGGDVFMMNILKLLCIQLHIHLECHSIWDVHSSCAYFSLILFVLLLWPFIVLPSLSKRAIIIII